MDKPVRLYPGVLHGKEKALAPGMVVENRSSRYVVLNVEPGKDFHSVAEDKWFHIKPRMELISVCPSDETLYLYGWTGFSITENMDGYNWKLVEKPYEVIQWNKKTVLGKVVLAAFVKMQMREVELKRAANDEQIEQLTKTLKLAEGTDEKKVEKKDDEEE